MSAAALEAVAWKLSTWVAARLTAPRRTPLPMSGVRGQLAAIFHSPHGAALLTAIAIFVIVHVVRSAWLDVYRRWYPQ
jgi:hypothetical protein